MSHAGPHLDLDRVRVRALRYADTALLQSFVAKEAVLPVGGPRDLARRLAPDRRVLSVEDDFGPLCFVQVAGRSLWSGLPGFVQVALTARPVASLETVLTGPCCGGPRAAATFYGITRVRDRARGSAGALRHETAQAVLAEHPSVESCATLSPMPGFRAWVEQVLDVLDVAGSAA